MIIFNFFLCFSHDLQTCDWPRNVGCGASVPVSVNNLEKVGTASRNPNDDNELTTVSWKHETPESNRNDIPDVSILMYKIFIVKNRFLKLVNIFA